MGTMTHRLAGAAKEAKQKGGKKEMERLWNIMGVAGNSHKQSNVAGWEWKKKLKSNGIK